MQKNSQDYLYLPNKKSLSVEESKAIYQFTRKYISLNNLQFLGEEQSKWLSTCSGKSMYLRGLTRLSEKEAEHLFQSLLDGMRLGGSFQKKILQKLTDFKGDWLSLDGLTSLDVDVAKELSKYEGRFTNGI